MEEMAIQRAPLDLRVPPQPVCRLITGGGLVHAVALTRPRTTYVVLGKHMSTCGS